MRKRSATADSEAEVAALPLRELDGQIQRLELRARKGGPFALSNSLRKSAFKKLIWLEAQRETLHAIPAPDRKFQD
jgi:hypothetical protein